jgi:hypothetical protein
MILATAPAAGQGVDQSGSSALSMATDSNRIELSSLTDNHKDNRLHLLYKDLLIEVSKWHTHS